ncbi:MAG: DEAD/DEAH box helicase [Clostridiales bacterium]|nr:DEAD/DEAH box helicase [Clostridiales bacterium]
MIFKPHKYQQYAIDFILNHPVSAIFYDMGMGKTSLTLMAINTLMYEYFEINKVLIIAPLRVAKNTWPAEIEKWEQLKGLRYSIVTGTPMQRMKALQEDADIYIINRENLSWLVEDSGFKFDFDMVVIDELSSFKSWQSKRFRSLMKVRPKIHRIVGLTGTPSSNGLMDLFAEFKVLDMGERLGRFISTYRLDYFRPDKMNGPIVYSYLPLPDAEERIYEKISDITISMKAADYLDMPELISSEYPVYLDAKEKAMYDDMKKDLILLDEENEITASNAATLSGKLSQMANGAVYSDSGAVKYIHDKKLDALEDIIESMCSKPLMVVYWFKHDYQRIAERLNKIGIKYQKLDTDESISQWNEGKIPVALVHPASAGHGLNLQDGGSTMVWFGITWSLELYQQTVARIYRQGQKSKTVVIQHIICKDTIDERILKALEKKDNTQTALIEAVKAVL